MTTREEILGAKVQRMLASLAGHSTVHLLGAETDLAQTNLLLKEAIEKLSASFMAIHEAVTEQQSAIDRLLAGTATADEVAGQLKRSREKVDTNVFSAVTGLQFQDMTSQLIGRTIRRVNGLHDVMSVLGVEHAGDGDTNQQDATITVLDNVSKILEDQSRELETMLRKGVNQTHMESGGIELF
jgi:hypothetical protein